MNEKVCHFRFKVPPTVHELSVDAARREIPLMFQTAINDLKTHHLLDDLEIVKVFPRMFAFQVSGPSESCTRLADYLAQHDLGKITFDEPIAVSR